jgi:predicted house-cleaning noncanonical NTP pyrophosphatase (MazG superfamily)
MNDRIITEEEYREALKRFIEILESGSESENEEELANLMRLLDTYEYENC